MSNYFRKSIKSSSFLLVANYATYGFQDLLYEYLLKQKVQLLTKINLPLPELPLLQHIEVTNVYLGREEKTKIISSMVQPTTASYLFQAMQYLLIVLASGKSYDYVIAQNSFLAFISIILRVLGKYRHVIYYSHGLDRTRFGHPFFNRLYQLLDTYSATHSEYNWCLSKNMIAIRKKQGIPSGNIFWVPASIPISSLHREKNNNSHKIIFLGVLNDKNGVGILPDIVREIQKKIPDATLDIMGEGNMKNEIIDKVKNLKLEKNIRILGNLTFKQFKDLLTYYRVGIVTYKYSTQNLIPTSDSMKMRVYIAAGLPVVITKGFLFSHEIEEYKLGFSVNYEVKAFANKIIQILSNDHLNKKFRTNALAYSKKLDLTEIYNKTFLAILRKKEK